MQKFYPYKVKDALSLAADAGTERITLPHDGQATALDLIFNADNGTTANLNNIIPYNITKVDLVGDGVDHFLTLDGYALWKVLWLLHGKRPDGRYTEMPNTDQRTVYRFLFGRFMNDPEYLLNLNKYSEISLDVTYNLAAVNPVSATDGFISGSGEIDVTLHKTLPGVTMPTKGCRRIIERKSVTSVASGDIEWSFVQDYPYLGLFVYNRLAGTDANSVLTNIKLDMGGGKPVLYDFNWRELERYNNELMQPDCEYYANYYKQHGDYIETHVGLIAQCNPIHYAWGVPGTNSMIYVTPGTAVGDKVRLVMAALDPVSSVPTPAGLTWVRARTLGYSVGNLVYLPLADYPEFTNALAPADVKDAILRLTQGMAGATLKVISDQIMSQ